MNAIVKAHQALTAHISAATKGQQSEEDVRAELMKLTKNELVDRLMQNIRTSKVKIEDIVKPILADDDCTWLELDTIATAIATATGSNTSAKSLASYSSKYPKEKGWIVKPRKSARERQEELKKLLGC